MAIGISVTMEDLETLTTRISLTGLTAGTRYDVYRVAYREVSQDDTGVRHYERELPDRRGLWSSVAHRIGWVAPATTATFRDYECPLRAVKYFCCATSVIGPHEYDFDDGPYPMSRGALSAQIVHWQDDIEDILHQPIDRGNLLVRSVHELAHYVSLCVVEMDGPTYTARVNEHAVMGNQYPVIISDSREARRGTITLLTRDLGQYNALRRIVFPASGKIRPVMFQSSGSGPGGSAILLDDMRVIPLDVEVEQAMPPIDVNMRFIHIDYVEADPTEPLISRSGDNDSLISEPHADFTVTPAHPALGQWATLTSTSTGSGDTFEWTIDPAGESNAKGGKFFTQGPHQVRWSGSRGAKTVKLRFGSSVAGFNTRVKTVQVG
jgi:hypothetical protein